MKPLLFLGSSLGIPLYVEAAERQGITVAGILDSDYYGNTEIFKGIPVVGTEQELDKYRDQYDFFIATNSSPDPEHQRDIVKRQQLIDIVEQHSVKCVNLIDPETRIADSVQLGHGVFIGYKCYIEHGVEIGDFCQIFYDAGISHDVKIGKNTVIQRKCGIGNTTIGDNVYVGMWVNIFCSTHVTIGDNATINQGLWVVRNVESGEHVKLTREAIRVYKNLTIIE